MLDQFYYHNLQKISSLPIIPVYHSFSLPFHWNSRYHTLFSSVQPEPFFVSMYLVNADEGRRISEEFYWNPNSASVDGMIPPELFRNLAWSQLTADPDLLPLEVSQPRSSVISGTQKSSRGFAPQPPTNVISSPAASVDFDRIRHVRSVSVLRFRYLNPILILDRFSSFPCKLHTTLRIGLISSFFVCVYLVSFHCVYLHTTSFYQEEPIGPSLLRTGEFLFGDAQRNVQWRHFIRFHTLILDSVSSVYSQLYLCYFCFCRFLLNATERPTTKKNENRHTGESNFQKIFFYII